MKYFSGTRIKYVFKENRIFHPNSKYLTHIFLSSGIDKHNYFDLVTAMVNDLTSFLDIMKMQSILKVYVFIFFVVFNINKYYIYISC